MGKTSKNYLQLEYMYVNVLKMYMQSRQVETDLASQFCSYSLGLASEIPFLERIGKWDSILSVYTVSKSV